MSNQTELAAASEYISDVMWEAEDAHYRDVPYEWDQAIHGRVYALWDVSRAFSELGQTNANPTRAQILDAIAVVQAPLEARYAATPNSDHLDLGGRIFVLREVSAGIEAGRHLEPRARPKGVEPKGPRVSD
ncbi:hypothetical protein MMB232_00730 [Brevundimonas subvibrioides]|uniref:hypothetical protein n=1 Tax=Brevundimonas subvibrioides TaxID=74313 RepID=UPI0032D58F8A